MIRETVTIGSAVLGTTLTFVACGTDELLSPNASGSGGSAGSAGSSTQVAGPSGSGGSAGNAGSSTQMAGASVLDCSADCSECPTRDSADVFGCLPASAS